MSGDLFSAIGSGIVILPSDHGAIGDPKINDRNRKKRDLFSDLYDIYFGSDFTRICQVTLKKRSSLWNHSVLLKKVKS